MPGESTKEAGESGGRGRGVHGDPGDKARSSGRASKARLAQVQADLAQGAENPTPAAAKVQELETILKGIYGRAIKEDKETEQARKPRQQPQKAGNPKGQKRRRRWAKTREMHLRRSVKDRWKKSRRRRPPKNR